VTIEDFRAKARNFEVALDTQEGAVTFEFGGVSSEVLMKVRERDGMAGIARLTPELRARTVNETFIIGVQEDGSYLRVTVRESHFLIVGIMGSGKSNLLNVLIAQLASMVDTVVWMIDMKSGRAGRPWFQAWSDGKADAPPVDWLATTRAEAEKMMTAVEKATDVRSASGIGGDKIIPSAGLPQLVLIVDEMADLWGDGGNSSDIPEGEKTNNWFTKKGTRATQKGRSEAIATLWATQRGTNGMSGSGDMKSNMDVSIALKPRKLADLQWIIPDAPALAGRQLAFLANTPGVGMVGRGPQVSQVSKFLRHGHVDGECGKNQDNPRCVTSCDIYQSAIEVGPVRPRLDRMTATALGTDYAQRWARAAQAGVLRVPEHALSGGSALYGGNGDSGRFDEVIAGLEDPERSLHPGRVRMREFLSTRGVSGSSVKVIGDVLDHEGIGVDRGTIHRWLREDAADDLVHHPSFRLWVSGPGTVIEGE
jgi:hypothetical protein